MLNVAIAWHVYAVTHNPMSLAYVGLARFLPNIGVALIAGQAADRFDKRSIIRLSIFLQTLCMALLGISLRLDRLSLGVVYLLLLIIGAAQAFSFPAVSAIQPQLVDAQEFPRAVALSSSVFQICSLAGPAVGGLIYALSGPGMFAAAAGLYLIALTQVHGLPRVCVLHGATEDSGCTDQTALGGIRYIRSNHLLLSLISLDLFAVLLGGVTALLPIYAKDILALGPTGLGCLRCAPGVGAAIVGMFLAQRTINRGAGKLMLACVAGFGFATIVFAISTNLYLSIAALMVAGGFDMVSMVIRQTLAQIATPDAMRGRVGAVQWVFVGASSELGEFESGITAALFGVMPAAVLGGIGTLAIVALWTKIFPELPSVDRLVT
jgi:MFS family permease